MAAWADHCGPEASMRRRAARGCKRACAIGDGATTKTGSHTFRATNLAVYFRNDGTDDLQRAAAVETSSSLYTEGVIPTIARSVAPW